MENQRILLTPRNIWNMQDQCRRVMVAAVKARQRLRTRLSMLYLAVSTNTLMEKVRRVVSRPNVTRRVGGHSKSRRNTTQC